MSRMLAVIVVVAALFYSVLIYSVLSCNEAQARTIYFREADGGMTPRDGGSP